MAELRTFRQHRITVVAPGLPWFLLSLAIVAGTLYLGQEHHQAPWLLALLALPGWKLARLWLLWLAYSVVYEAGSQAIEVRSALVGRDNLVLPLAQINPKGFSRPWWARLLGADMGSITIMAIGGPYVLPRMGEASALWTIISSHGKEVPDRRRSVLAVLLVALGQGLAALARRAGVAATSRARGPATRQGQPGGRGPGGGRDQARKRRRRVAPAEPVFAHEAPRLVPRPPKQARPGPARVPPAARGASEEGGQAYQGVAFSSRVASEAGLKAFVEQFCLSNRNWTPWSYRVRDAQRRYYRDGLAEGVASLYLAWLRANCVLIPGPGGSEERVSARIHSVADVERILARARPPWAAPRSGGQKKA